MPHNGLCTVRWTERKKRGKERWRKRGEEGERKKGYINNVRGKKRKKE